MKLALLAVLVSCSSPPKPQPAPPRQPEPTPEPTVTNQSEPKPVEDPYLWLEEVTSDKALAWARERNATSEGELGATTGFKELRERIRGILDSKEKTPHVAKRGKWLYNFWTDAQNPKGLLRRTTLAEYKKPEPKWETVLDVDKLAADENENWVFAGQDCIYPTYDRCLISFSRGGGDAHVTREFDPIKKQFIADGFTLPEAKSSVSWIDKDTIFVGTDFGPGSMTAAGYPRIVKEWKRGTKLADAKLVFEGKPSDIAIGGGRSWDHGKAYDLVYRYVSMFQSEVFLLQNGKQTKLDVPDDASPGIWNDHILVTLRSDWTVGGKTYPRGAALVAPLADFLAGKRDFTMIFEPSPTKSLEGISELKTALVTNELEDVKNVLYVWTVKAGTWSKRPFGKPSVGTTSVRALEAGGMTDEYWESHSDYLTPSTLSLGKLGAPAQVIKKSPSFFEAKGLHVEQHFAKSKDGTRVPYFQISRKTLALDGKAPTLLYGYGGFEISMTPGYNPVSGAAWIEKGGVYVVANIRGGGEYGPAWHQAAKGHDKQRSYDDFIAVAEDLIARKVTASKHLGISGGSNGGLLTSVMLTQRPELFGAVVSSVPLTDMKRFPKLLAGSAWVEEYGDPEKPEDWAVLATYSPYHNVKRGVKYPRVLYTSSTRDDRVHPAHARKMVARMLEQGHDVLYYENIEGGHGGAANNEQYAHLSALEYVFLAKTLGLQ